MGMYQINTGGNLVCIKDKSRYDKIIGLTPLNWQKVKIDRDKTTNKLYYEFDGKSNQRYSRDQVFHVPGPSINGVIGMTPLEFASQSVRLGLTYEKFAVNFFKNGAMPSGIFKHPGFLKEDAYARLKTDLEKNYQSLVNAGKPILAEDGLDFVPFSMKLVDAELLSSKKFQIEEICRVYRVPLHLVQNLDKATNNNIEHQSLEFAMYTMLPHFKRWEECINCQLLNAEQRNSGHYFEFNMSTLMRGDAASMATAFATGRQWGWLSVNDIRRMLNMNAIPNGDLYLQPMNMIEAGEEPTKPENKILDEVSKIIEARGK